MPRSATSPPPGLLTLGAAALGSGLLLGLATTQLGLGLLGFVAAVPLLMAIDAGAGPARGAFAGWLAGALCFGIGLLFAPLSGVRGPELAVVVGYVIALGASVGGFAGMVAWLRERDRVVALAAAPLLFVGAELVRSAGVLGYPWQHLGYAVAAYPSLLGLASIGGVHALSGWMLGASSLLVALRASPLLAAALVPLWIAGPALLLRPPPAAGESVRVAGVQPRILETGRLESARFRANLGRLLELSAGTLADAPELLVWPESAYERALREETDPLLGAVARLHGVPLLTGLWRLQRAPAAALFNSAALVASDGSLRFAGDKVHPVPFFEAGPETPFERWLSRGIAWPGAFRRGEPAGVGWLGREGEPPIALGVLICLDSSYPGLARELRRRGARLLVELSNESRTGAWSAEQHAHVSRLRAVETGLPLVRVGNIGPTEWIDSSGRVIERLEPGTSAAATVTVALGSGATTYVRYGDPPVLAAGLLPPLLTLVRRRARHAVLIGASRWSASSWTRSTS